MKLLHKNDLFIKVEEDKVDVDEDFQLTILNEGRGYRVRIKGRELKDKSASLYDEDNAFSLQNGKFIWKKENSSVKSSIKLKIGAFDCEEIASNEALNGLMLSAIREIGRLKADNEAARSKLEESEKKCEKTAAKMKKMSEEKAKFEEELYERFLPVLNEKKMRIGFLERNPGNRRQSNDHEDDDDEDGNSYGSNTDVEEGDEDEEPRNKRAKKDESLDDSQNFLNI